MHFGTEIGYTFTAQKIRLKSDKGKNYNFKIYDHENKSSRPVGGNFNYHNAMYGTETNYR